MTIVIGAVVVVMEVVVVVVCESSSQTFQTLKMNMRSPC
jgi:hypothetical protein